MIAYHQKQIRVADWLEFGWVKVAQYDRDELTSYRDDKKQLFKAERNAEHTQKKRRQGTSRSTRDSVL